MVHSHESGWKWLPGISVAFTSETLTNVVANAALSGAPEASNCWVILVDVIALIGLLSGEYWMVCLQTSHLNILSGFSSKLEMLCARLFFSKPLLIHWNWAPMCRFWWISLWVRETESPSAAYTDEKTLYSLWDASIAADYPTPWVGMSVERA